MTDLILLDMLGLLWFCWNPDFFSQDLLLLDRLSCVDCFIWTVLSTQVLLDRLGLLWFSCYQVIIDWLGLLGVC